MAKPPAATSKTWRPVAAPPGVHAEGERSSAPVQVPASAASCSWMGVRAGSWVVDDIRWTLPTIGMHLQSSDAMADTSDALPLPPRLLAQPAYVLSLLGRAARAGAIEAIAAQGLRLGHVAVLAALEDFGPSAQRVLGARLRQDPSDVLRLLDDLQAKSYITRAPDPDDRRRHRVTITVKGQRALLRPRPPTPPPP